MSKIGIDIHGVIDTNPEYFSWVIETLRSNGHSIHIITGSPYHDMDDILDEWDIDYDAYFSISDWCKQNSPTYYINNKGEISDRDSVWDNVKAKYCDFAGIDVHIDDSVVYQKTFDNISTDFILYNSIEMDECLVDIINKTLFDRTARYWRDNRHERLKQVIFNSELYAMWEDSIEDTSIVDNLVKDILNELGR